MTLTFLWLVIGLVLLVVGAEGLVRGASALAVRAGVSSLVVGLTVVAFGTSAPEVAVSVKAAVSAEPEIAAGNVVGSNIFNVLFILGLCALILPLSVSRELVRRDVPVMILVSLASLLLARDGRVSRVEGLGLLAGLGAYTFWIVQASRASAAAARAAQTPEEQPPPGKPRSHWVRNGALVLGGLAVLVLGARLLVGSATEIARSLGISELVIGLTLVAAGTSLPEVATSVIASLRGERDIAVGNVVGSNLFNLLGVLGLSAAASPEGLPVAPSLLSFDVPVMIAVAVACLPIFATGHLIARWEGAFFFLYYSAYTVYLILRSAEHDALPAYSRAMLFFVGPISLVTLAVVTLRSLLRERRSPANPGASS